MCASDVTVVIVFIQHSSLPPNLQRSDFLEWCFVSGWHTLEPFVWHLRQSCGPWWHWALVWVVGWAVWF